MYVTLLGTRRLARQGACGTMFSIQRYVSNAYAKNMDLWLLSYNYIVILA
jgi:hypothetical protein